MMSRSREDYLRALYIIEERKGELKSSDVAKYLEVSRPAVSEMARKLCDDGLIRSFPYAKLQFTGKGRRLASELTTKHRLIELFLKKVLKRSEAFIHDEAHRLEHAFSDESIKKIRKMLGDPKIDPHGKPIPK